METPQKYVSLLREEFSKHVASQSAEPFSPPMEITSAVSILTRELETKREQGTLGDEDLALLDLIDAVWEDIAKFNAQVRKSPPAFITEKVYDLSGGPAVEPKEKKLEPAPKISQAQADEIIAGLNQQFEEKIMSKIHKNETAPSKISEARPTELGGDGRSIQELIHVLRS